MAPDYSGPKYGTNGGTIYYDVSHGQLFLYSQQRYSHGYGAHVIIGEEYSIHGLQWKDDIFVEVSDPILATQLQSSQDTVEKYLNFDYFRFHTSAHSRY